MRIFLDADSCPRPVRDLIIRSSERTKIPVVFAANRPIPGAGENVVMEICPPVEGAADNRIAEMAKPGDLAITRDLPLAERLVEAKVCVLDDRGRIYTRENIRYYRSIRDFQVNLAESGMGIERIANYGKKELKKFADSLDRELNRLQAAAKN
ncbi:MAG: DUF188 domain-containing protein [Treponema sp.]|nr:DUF188 domain-containing protein [Treponema sp.]